MQRAIACDLNNIGCHKMTVAQYVSHISTVKANFKSHSKFSNSGYAEFFQPLKVVKIILSL